MRALVLLALLGCGDTKHSLPKVEPGSNNLLPASQPPPAKIDTSTVSGRLRELFGATQSPDISGSIAKLEAQRATMPEAERKLVDRAIALMRSGDAAMKEPDREKSRALQAQMVRDTLALLDDMAAVGPDELDLQLMVAGSLTMLSSQVESLELTTEFPPRDIKQRARTIAQRLIKTHATAPKAWALHGALTPTDQPEIRMRSFATCLKLEPANAVCKQTLDDERADYVRPYCEPADFKGDVNWRVAAKAPTPGATQVEHHYEARYLAAAPKFTLKDVTKIRATVTREDTVESDGRRTTRMLDGVDFEMAPATRQAMLAWSRELEARGDERATMMGSKLLFTDQRALWEDSTPGIAGIKIDELCAKTKTRALPKD